MKQKLFCNFGHKILIPDAILKATPSNYVDISGIFSDFFKKSSNFRFCRGRIPTQNCVQHRFCTKITPEMKSSRRVRIQNTKFCYIPTSMKQVMASRKIFSFCRPKENIEGGEWFSPLTVGNWVSTSLAYRNLFVTKLASGKIFGACTNSLRNRGCNVV